MHITHEVTLAEHQLLEVLSGTNKKNTLTRPKHIHHKLQQLLL